MEWFRFYHDAVDDPKVQRLSPKLFKHWINILCISSRNSDRGTLPNRQNIAFSLRVPESKVDQIIDALLDAGLIDKEGDSCLIHGWNSRQKRSDNVADRVAKHRASNEPVTLPHVRATETETETETDIPPKPPKGRSAKTAIPDDFANMIPVDVFDAIGTEQSMSVLELNRETNKMIDHYRSKGEKRVDWIAAWRNWMRSDFRKPKTNGSSPPRNGALPFYSYEEEQAARAANPMLRNVYE